MAAAIKITRPLAALLLRDLPGYIAAAGKAGIPPPKLELTYADGLSRADAKALHDWGMQIPALRAARSNTAHADHGAVQGYLALANHFANEHPQTADGRPANWTEPLSPAMREYVLGERGAVAVNDLHPAEAAAFLQHFETRSDLVAAHRDKTAAGHETIMEEFAALHGRAANAEAPAAVTETAQGGQAMALDAATKTRIDELNAALRNTDPKTRLVGWDRKAVVDELNALYAAVPDGEAAHAVAPARPAGALPATAAEAQQQINALFGDKEFRSAYLTKSSPDHSAAVERMTALHEALAPAESAPSAEGAA